MALKRLCDRCGAKCSAAALNFIVRAGGENKDLCRKCEKKLARFMEGENEVGDWVFVKTETPCPHYVPCAGPCGDTVYKKQPR